MDCQSWLKDLLAKNGDTLCEYARQQAKKQGFSKKQLKEARDALGVKTFHQFDGGPTVNWFWYLEENNG